MQSVKQMPTQMFYCKSTALCVTPCT